MVAEVDETIRVSTKPQCISERLRLDVFIMLDNIQKRDRGAKTMDELCPPILWNSTSILLFASE